MQIRKGTHRKNPSADKFRGVDDFVLLPFANPLRRGHRLSIVAAVSHHSVNVVVKVVDECATDMAHLRSRWERRGFGSCAG